MKMEKWIGLLLILVLLLTGCKSSKAVEQISTTNWQEQYDLGVRYLSEGNYQEAIIAFTAAIEIDPKRPETYARLATVYEQMGDIDSAIAILEQGISATGDNDLTNQLDALNRPNEIELTDEARTILDEFYRWIPERNYSHLGDFAREYWNENHHICTGYDKSDLWGMCYDGKDPSWDFTGIGLKIINEYCWYYGPLENGVPQGEGMCVGYNTGGSYVVYEGSLKDGKGSGSGVLTDVYYDKDSNQYSIRGTWDGSWLNGSLDGEAIITSYFRDNIFSQYRILLSEGKIVLDDRWVKDGDEYFLESEIGSIRMVYNDDMSYIAYLGMFDE